MESLRQLCAHSLTGVLGLVAPMTHSRNRFAPATVRAPGHSAFPLAAVILFELLFPLLLVAVWVLIGRCLLHPMKNNPGRMTGMWKPARTAWILMNIYIVLFTLTAIVYFASEKASK
jgi:uncharacterized RDD family membrane protein YckC